MSLTTVVTVHCDSCGRWEYASNAGRSNARWLRNRGWVINARDADDRRVDYCPTHAGAASPTETSEETPNG